MTKEKNSKERLKRQKQTYLAIAFGTLLIFGGVIFLTTKTEETRPTQKSPTFSTVSEDVDAENIRLAHLENLSDVINERVHDLEKNLLEVREENFTLQKEKNFLIQETEDLQSQILTIEETQQQQVEYPAPLHVNDYIEPLEPNFTAWELEREENERNVLFEIPAGTVVKALLVSGADCGVGIKPTGPNMVLLRPLDNGKLPRNVKVPLKGSVIIGNAIGDIASERVYIRCERMTLVEKNGNFVETETSAYVSGEDGREGLRGVVVDRSGQIIRRASFAAFFQGISQSIQATLNNQTIEKLSQVNADKTILNIDTIQDSAFQGVSTSLEKLSEYYIKRAEQLQPAIQIAAGRVVDIIFTKSVKVGESDLKKRIAYEREQKEQYRG